jgi:predicted nucleic acid-binding protein
MVADIPFFDTSYLVRFYLEDAGFEAVRECAGAERVISAAWHAQSEVVAALHRAFRERRMEQGAFQAALDQFIKDSKDGLFRWLPLTDGVRKRVEQIYRQAPASVFLRSADALHLACAAEHDFMDVYSNDRHFLAAAPLFGLRGINVIGSGVRESRAAYRTSRKPRAYLFRDGNGKEYKPEDYLTAFYRYVRQNKSSVEAIRILLNRPRQWSTDSLIELRKTLASAPERFTEQNLQRVHSVCCQKVLADLISMVKHAAFDQEPLLTAEERVDRAMTAIAAGRTFKPDQQRWLDRIREHLMANLTIDREDFDGLPIFMRDGGWSVANRVFEGRLSELILEINGAIAA